MFLNKLALHFLKRKKIRLKSRHISTMQLPDDKIRNIAILAHIDAGEYIVYSQRNRNLNEKIK